MEGGSKVKQTVKELARRHCQIYRPFRGLNGARRAARLAAMRAHCSFWSQMLEGTLLSIVEQHTRGKEADCQRSCEAPLPEYTGRFAVPEEPPEPQNERYRD